jgi:meiotically up-regulated gene 157 (Mug157) protein
MDDANVPSLLAMPYLNAIENTDPVYINTRKMLWSLNNPFFFQGDCRRRYWRPARRERYDMADKHYRTGFNQQR